MASEENAHRFQRFVITRSISFVSRLPCEVNAGSRPCLAATHCTRGVTRILSRTQHGAILRSAKRNFTRLLTRNTSFTYDRKFLEQLNGPFVPMNAPGS